MSSDRDRTLSVDEYFERIERGGWAFSATTRDSLDEMKRKPRRSRWMTVPRLYRPESQSGLEP